MLICYKKGHSFNFRGKKHKRASYKHKNKPQWIRMEKIETGCVNKELQNFRLDISRCRRSTVVSLTKAHDRS